MRQFIRCAPGAWHFKAQVQVWRKRLLNHIIQLPSAEVNNHETNKGESARTKKAESRG